MKKLLYSISFIICMSFLSSCQKEYTCTCSDGMSTFTIQLYYYSQAKAQQVCNSDGQSSGAVCTVH